MLIMQRVVLFTVFVVFSNYFSVSNWLKFPGQLFITSYYCPKNLNLKDVCIYEDETLSQIIFVQKGDIRGYGSSAVMVEKEKIAENLTQL